jgi:hypothetical protein
MVPAHEPSLPSALLHHGFITGGLKSRLVALIKRNNDARRKSITVAGSLGWEFRMNEVLEPSDECPHCRLPLEILRVKVGLRGTAMVYACTNCAMTRTQNPKQQPPRRLLSALSMIGAKFGQHFSSKASHEPAIVGAQGSAHDAHDRLEGPTGTIGIVALNKSAAKTAPLRTSQPVSTVDRTDMAISPDHKTLCAEQRGDQGAINADFAFRR